MPAHTVRKRLAANHPTMKMIHRQHKMNGQDMRMRVEIATTRPVQIELLNRATSSANITGIPNIALNQTPR